MRMKKLVLSILPLALLLQTCVPDFDWEENVTNDSFILPGTPATFTINDPNNTNIEINGDAYSVGYGFFDGPGSAMHKDIDSYEPLEYFYELECFGSYESGIHLYFDFYTTSLGQPLDSITTGMYYAHNAYFSQGSKSYVAYHYDDPVINQQVYAAIQVTHKKEGRIDGSFTGKYYEAATGQIVTITGKFKNVFVHNDVW